MDTPCLKSSDYTCLEEGSSVNHKTKSKLSGKEKDCGLVKMERLGPETHPRILVTHTSGD